MERHSEGESSHSEQDRRLLFWRHVPFGGPAGFLFIFLSESISNYPFPLDKANQYNRKPLLLPPPNQPVTSSRMELQPVL
jgi:hypothetical protein